MFRREFSSLEKLLRNLIQYTDEKRDISNWSREGFLGLFSQYVTCSICLAYLCQLFAFITELFPYHIFPFFVFNEQNLWDLHRSNSVTGFLYTTEVRRRICTGSSRLACTCWTNVASRQILLYVIMETQLKTG